MGIPPGPCLPRHAAAARRPSAGRVRAGRSDHRSRSRVREFAEELARDLGYLAEIDGNPLAYHIDWDSWARELFCGDYWSADAPGGLQWIFATC